MRRPHLVTSSRANGVRITIEIDGREMWVEGPPEEAEDNAWCILDSICHAYLKAGLAVPRRIIDAGRLLHRGATPGQN